MVLGGYDERGISEGLLASCDLYDPVEETWIPDGAAPLLRSRWGHGCASLRGRIYAVGGCSLQEHGGQLESAMETLKSCEVYDPEQNRWSQVASLQVPRSGCRVVALGDRYLAAVGGCDDVFGAALTQATVEIFDVTTGQWTILDQNRLVVPRTSAAVAAIDAESFIVAGGAPSQSSAELFRLPADRRSGLSASETGESLPSLPDMFDGRMGCQAATVSLPRVKLASAEQMVEIDLTGSESSDSCNEASAKMRHAALEVDGHMRCVLVVGGERGGETTPSLAPRPPTQLSSCVAFDLEAGKWCPTSFVPALATARTTTALCVGIGHVRPRPLFCQ